MKNFLFTKGEIEKCLDKIDTICTDYDDYEYGIPLHKEDILAQITLELMNLIHNCEG